MRKITVNSSRTGYTLNWDKGRYRYMGVSTASNTFFYYPWGISYDHSNDRIITYGYNAKKVQVFDENGTVTAGTASPLTDGASAVIVCEEEYAKKNNLNILARIKSTAVVGCPPELMGLGPINASKKALKRANLSISDIDIVELNEAFASQSLACIKELNMDINKVNIHGGAIALGHPLGATGARITGKVATLLQNNNKKYGLATQCIGLGQGIATVLENIN